MSDAQHSSPSQITSLVQLLDFAAERFAERPLFGTLEGEELRFITYAEFAGLVDKFRGALHGLGVARGDAVGLISNNRVEWAVCAHAAFGLGAHIVPMYEAGHSDWQYVLEDAGVSVCMLANDAVAARLAPLRAALPKLREVVNFEGPAQAHDSYAGLLASAAARPAPKLQPAPADIAVIMYTSGTMGRPKGVRLTHCGLASNVVALRATLEVSDGDRALSFLPWAHIFGGCIELNTVVYSGVSSVICPDPMRLPHYLSRVQPTVLIGVPRVWNKIYDTVTKLMAGQPLFQTALRARAKQRRDETLCAEELQALTEAQETLFPSIRGVLGGRLKYVASGAAALSREVGEFMDTLGIEVYEGFGMTETGGVATSTPFRQIRLGSVGKALPGVRIVIDESVSGAAAGEGEIIVYSPGVMAAYQNQEEATRAALTADGGLRTGDMGRVDADGYLYITGRVKELYKLANGKYVAPVPLEEALSLSPYIAQAVVYGSGKPNNVALLVPDLPAIHQWAKQHAIEAEGEALLSGALSGPQVLGLLEAEVEKINRSFRDYERIKRFVVESEELNPQNGLLTQTLKLKRRTFHEKYGSVMEALYPRRDREPPPRASYIRTLQTQASREA